MEREKGREGELNEQPGQFAVRGPGSAAAKSRINHEAVALCRPSLSSACQAHDTHQLHKSSTMKLCVAHTFLDASHVVGLCERGYSLIFHARHLFFVTKFVSHKHCR